MAAEQGTIGWLLERNGHVTASEFDCIVKTPRKSEGFTDSAMTYLYKLMGEHCAGFPDDDFESFAMKRGSELEPQAREDYMWATGNPVATCGFQKHPTELWIGSSPDGLVGKEGIIEIKCPLTYQHHMKVIDSGEVPPEHYAQCQGNLWVTGRSWCDFISYDPRMKKTGMQIVVVRVLRDCSYVETLEERVCRFRDLLIEKLVKKGIVP